MKSPKQRFLELKPIAQEHRDMVDRDTTVESLDMALLQLIHELTQATISDDAAAKYWKIEGARQYIRTFVHLADLTPDKAAPIEDNLRRV